MATKAPSLLPSDFIPGPQGVEAGRNGYRLQRRVFSWGPPGVSFGFWPLTWFADLFHAKSVCA